MNRLSSRIRSSPRYKWWALVSVLLGFFSTGITITILSAVLPTIAEEFEVGTHTVAWVVTGPMVIVGVLTPTMGKAADLYGRKRMYLLGWAGMAAFTGLAAFSWSAGSLITFRCLAAAAGAATGPTAMALILAAFPAPERVTAMGWWAFMGAGAPVIGLVAGGPLVDAFGWRLIFHVVPPLALPGLVFATLALRPDRAAARPAFDVRGSVLLGGAIGSLLLAMNRGGAGGWSGADVLVPLGAFPLLVVAFISAERRHPEPLLRLEYFARRNVAVPIVLQLLSHAPYMGSFFLAPFLLRDLLGYDSTRTAVALLPRPLANSLASALAGYVAVRVGERTTAMVGMAAMTAGLAAMAAIGDGSSLVFIGLALGAVGAGMGVSLPGLVSSVANSVSEKDFGAIAAVQSMVTMVGMVLGMQGLQTIHAVRVRSVGGAVAYRDAFLFAAGVSAVAAALSLAVRSMHRAQAVPPEESPEAPMIPAPVSEAD